MGILRSDIISHSQLEGSGSVELDGVGDYLTFASHSAFTAGTSDVTFELWVYLTDSTDLSNGNYYLFDMGSNGYRLQIYQGTLYFGDGSNTTSGSGITKNAWHHVAGIRDGGAKKLYLDGNLINQNACSVNHSTTTLTIGSYSTGGGDYEPYGYISNFRYVRGVVYKDNFTPPKFELKNIPGTIVLGCQSSSSATDFAVTPSTVTANGDATASAFHPGLKKDITDTGVVFDGVTTFDSQAYMVPPSGKTSERNRGRGLIIANYIATDSSNYNTSEFITIQSMGNSQDFGDTSAAVRGHATLASSTRAVSASGYVAPANVNTIEFFTIATQSNSTDFGDMNGGNGSYTPISNETRGIFAGGYAYPSLFNNIDFITIATTGNSQDFGGLTTLRADSNRSAVNSSTRGLIAGGYISPTGTNNIEFVTIATTGNSQDFADLTAARSNFTGLCSSTRGVFAGGTNPSNNIIDFVTIASQGTNASDFGDMFVNQAGACASTSNNTRGVIVGGDLQPSNAFTNTMQFVTIATTGDTQDFGDMLTVGAYRNATSDSHGGLE